MTAVEKIIIITFIVLAVFFFIDLIANLIMGYLEGKRQAEREIKIDKILELIDKHFEDNIFPEFGGEK